MARLGRKRRLELESQYWELLLLGVGTFKACEIVGSQSAVRPATGGGRRTVAFLRPGWRRQRGRGGICRCWNGSGSRPYTPAAWGCRRSRSGWAAPRRR
jgi:hypothetical protein